MIKNIAVSSQPEKKKKKKVPGRNNIQYRLCSEDISTQIIANKSIIIF